MVSFETNSLVLPMGVQRQAGIRGDRGEIIKNILTDGASLPAWTSDNNHSVFIIGVTGM